MPGKAELVWDGKYDANGRRVAPLRVALPFQSVETINESAQDRSGNLFQAAHQARAWRNRLIWGDKKYVLPSLLPEFAGKVDLIYIDPPFDTGADFSFTASIPSDGLDTHTHTRIHETTEPHRAEGVPRHLGKRPAIISPLVLRDSRGAPRASWRKGEYLRPS